VVSTVPGGPGGEGRRHRGAALRLGTGQGRHPRPVPADQLALLVHELDPLPDRVEPDAERRPGGRHHLGQPLQACPLLRELQSLNFVGNVEGRDLLLGSADVIVCDGFVGNVALKLAESASEFFFSLVRDAAGASVLAKIGALLVRPALRNVRKRLDYREHGGAPLLGVQGVCLIGHGRADALAVESACRGAMRAVRQDLVGNISRVIGLGSDKTVQRMEWST